MRCLLLILLVLVAPGLATAQEPLRPILRTVLEKESALPGQPIILRITLLTPTWLTKPPLFPSFETPNVIVRLPSRASGPVSERIGGETWSGVTRAYRLYPMTLGRFRIPPQAITVVFADPEMRRPLTANLRTESITFEGIAPAEVADLDPFIAAEELALEQVIEGEPGKLEPGGAVTRTVTARAEGLSPIFLPPLIPPLVQQGLAAYPKEPVVSESEDRGVLSGDRVESTTYVAEAGGRFKAPPIRLRWFNLKTNRVETAELAGFEMLSRGPPPAAASWAFDWRAAAPWIIGCALALGLAVAAVVRLRPRIEAWRKHRGDAYRRSEAFAFAQAKAALRARDLGAALSAIARWTSRLPQEPKQAEARLTWALADLGRAYYGLETARPSSRQWSEALGALCVARREFRAANAAAQTHNLLPPLNPVQP